MQPSNLCNRLINRLGIMLLIGFPFTVAAQSADNQQPEFPGGTRALSKFITKNIRFKTHNGSTHAEDMAIVGFVVKTDGQLANVQLEYEVNPSAAEAILSAFQKSPQWQPAIVNGMKVNRYAAVPIALHSNGIAVLNTNENLWKSRSLHKSLTYYINSHDGSQGYPVTSENEADAYRTVFYPENAQNDGLLKVIDYYLNKSPKLKATSVSYSPSVFLEGACMQFYPNGKRKSISTYSANKLAGEEILYYPSAKPYAIRVHKDDERPKLVQCIDSLGNFTAQNGEGKWIEYDQDLQKITLQGTVHDSLPIGTWTGRLNDTLIVNIEYTNGKLMKGETTAASGRTYPFAQEHTGPAFNGGIDEFYNFLSKRVRYPAQDREQDITGKVVFSFVIEKDGALSNFTILKSVSSSIDKETERVMRLTAGYWIPALKYGVLPCRSLFVSQVNFSIEKGGAWVKPKSPF